MPPRKLRTRGATKRKSPNTKRKSIRRKRRTTRKSIKGGADIKLLQAEIDRLKEQLNVTSLPEDTRNDIQQHIYELEQKIVIEQNNPPTSRQSDATGPPGSPYPYAGFTDGPEYVPGSNDAKYFETNGRHIGKSYNSGTKPWYKPW